MARIDFPLMTNTLCSLCESAVPVETGAGDGAGTDGD